MRANDEFKGPTRFSNRISFQDGDQSANSNVNESFVLPENPILNSNKEKDKENIYKSRKFSMKKFIIGKKLQDVFVNNLLDRSYMRKIHQLSPYQIQQCDDLQIEKRGFTKSRLEFWNLINVFTPYSKFIVIWGVFQILTYLMIFFWLPYKISFLTGSMSELLFLVNNDAIEILFLIILVLDIAVNVNTAYIEKGQLIKTRRNIFQHYYSNAAFVDLVSFFTISTSLLLFNQNKAISILFIQISLCFIFYILRIKKINNILAQILEFFNLSGYLNDLVGLFKVLMVIVGVVHIFGCIWHGIAYYNSSYTWLDAYDLRHKSNVSRYNVAIYWATMTMTTVGYGDITAKNDLELLINNITMFLGSIVFAYSVNSIGILVTNMYKGTIEYSKTVSLINTFMSKNKIPFDLQTKIRSYLEYIWQEEQNMNDDEVGLIINKLSKNLQEEIQYQLRGNILKQCKILNKLFSESFLKSLLHYVEEQSYCPEERIITVIINSIQMGEKDDCALYIITKGEVELIFEGEQMNNKIKRNSFKTYTQYDSFGEYALLTGNCRTLTVISNGFTRVMKLKRDHFLNIIKAFPDDYEKYCEIRDKASLNDFKDLEINCFSCQSADHMINNCHILHFQTDREKVIKKELYPISQQRKRIYFRKYKSFKWNALIASKYITKRAQEFYQDQISDSDDRTQFENDDDGDDDECQLNRQSISESLLFNMQSSETQNILRKSKQRLTNQIFELQQQTEKDIKNQHQPQSFKSIASQEPNIVQNYKQFKKAQENYWFHTQSQDMEAKIFFNKRVKSEVENILNQHQQKKTMQSNYISQNENYYLSLETIDAINQHFDKMQTFMYYSPYFNIDNVIRRYCNVQKGFGKRRAYPDFSLYTFYSLVRKKGWKLRRMTQQTRVKTLTKKKDFNQSQRIFFTKDIN